MPGWGVRCLADSATRFNHNHWRGLFGRVSYSGHFPIVMTDPNPMGKVGDVFVPDQHRMVGCREVVRGQGFPDTFLFHGTVANKFKQIGNAVPVLTHIGGHWHRAALRLRQEHTFPIFFFFFLSCFDFFLFLIFFLFDFFFRAFAQSFPNIFTRCLPIHTQTDRPLANGR